LELFRSRIAVSVNSLGFISRAKGIRRTDKIA